MTSTAAFFDVDGTLVSCQTQKVLATVMRTEGLVKDFDYYSMLIWFLIYSFGFTKDSCAMRKRSYAIFKNRSENEIEKVFKKASSLILGYARLDMKKVIENHRQRGDMIVAISASLSELCNPICQEFSIATLYATKLSTANGCYTGDWEGDIYEGVQKKNCIVKFSADNHLDLSMSSAYSDSYSDVPFLESVGRPVAVYPDQRLKQHALTNGWNIVGA